MRKRIRILIFLLVLSISVFLGRNKLAIFYYNRGNSYYERHMYKEAIDCFNKSLKINSSFAVVHYGLANAYMEEKLEDKAIEEYRKAVLADESFLWGYKALAHIYIRRSLYQEAMDTLEKAQTSVKNNPEIKDLINYTAFEYTASLLDDGIDAFSSGDKLKAYELLNKALQINPDYAYSRYLLGYLYYREGKYDQSESMLKEAVRLDSKFFWPHKLLGDIYFEKKVFNKAIEEYKSALIIKRNDAAILNNIGLAYMNLEKYSEAIESLREALALSPENVNIRYNLASLLSDGGQLDEASLEYKNVINASPDYANVHNDLGDIYALNGRNEEAKDEYRKEISFSQNKLLNNPNDPFVLNNVSYACNAIGEHDKAKELIERAIAVKPDYREAYLTLAGIQKNLGFPSEALAALEKAKGLSSQKYFFIEKAINEMKGEDNFIEQESSFNPVDTVYLKNGRQLKGIIKEETQEAIILETRAGNAIGTVTLSRNDIERIESD